MSFLQESGPEILQVFVCIYALGNFLSATVHFPVFPLPPPPRPGIDMEPSNALSSRPLAPAPANGRRSQSERRNQPQRENASSACSQCKARKQKVHLIHSRLVTSTNICVFTESDYVSIYYI